MTKKRFTNIEHDYENAWIKCNDDGDFMIYSIYKELDESLPSLEDLLNGLSEENEQLKKENKELKDEIYDLKSSAKDYLKLAKALYKEKQRIKKEKYEELLEDNKQLKPDNKAQFIVKRVETKNNIIKLCNNCIYWRMGTAGLNDNSCSLTEEWADWEGSCEKWKGYND